VDEYFGARGGQLIVGGLSITALVEQFGSPLYVYDPCIFRAKLARLRSAMPGLDVYYSIKANPTPAVIEVFLGEGCGLEVASKGELTLALRCGCTPDHIFFSGPGKTDQELKAAVEAGVGEVHVESLDEIARLAALAAQHGTTVGVGIRVNPSEVATGGAVSMGGRPSPFGLDEEMLAVAAERVLRSPGLALRGLHVYCGSQILNCEVLLNMYRHTLVLAGQLADRAGQSLETIDFGGGLGVPYFEGEQELQIEELRSRLIAPIREACARKGLNRSRLVVEPGRYLTAEGGLYVARVVGCKVSRGRKFVFLDGGMNHHLAASGNLGQVVRRNFPLAVANKLEEEPVDAVDVVGPLCTPLDTLARQVRLPEMEAGDIVVFFQSGAYARSASPLGFLSHPEPTEVFVQGGAARVVRQVASDVDSLRGTTLDDGLVLAETAE
jgi:diaminopimelate decarboxylase